MARHSEIKVGSTEWVVRVDGEDVQVKVVEKVPKASGRGYEFKVRRVDGTGQAVGRTLTRGSGALRKPGQPAREAPSFLGPVKSNSRKKSTPAIKKPPAKKRSKPSIPHSTLESSVLRPTLDPGPSPAKPRASEWFDVPSAEAGLPSLRGRGRVTSSSSSSSRAPARSRKIPAPKSEYPSKLVEKLCKALLKTDGSEWRVREAYLQVMGEHKASLYGGYG